jgi:SAM-dependent methyltransferase
VTDSDFDAAVKSYWEDPGTVSIIDKNLHELEIKTVLRHLASTDNLADIGCGDGQATVKYASKVKQCVGIERSGALRAKAAAAAEAAGLKNLTIRDGDVLELTDIKGEFDAIVTQRLLINLSSWEQQKAGLLNIHRMLKPGGRFLMIENTNDAFQAMNDVRAAVKLDPVPQHWHNRFFDRELLMSFLEGKFQLLQHYDFGLYYLLTRIYTQMFASFVGYGTAAVKDPIFEKADSSARELFELMGDRVKVIGSPAFGPIQVWALRREADPTDVVRVKR